MAYCTNLLFNSHELIPTFSTNTEVYYSQHSANGSRNNSKMLCSSNTTHRTYNIWHNIEIIATNFQRVILSVNLKVENKSGFTMTGDEGSKFLQSVRRNPLNCIIYKTRRPYFAAKHTLSVWVAALQASLAAAFVVVLGFVYFVICSWRSCIVRSFSSSCCCRNTTCKPHLTLPCHCCHYAVNENEKLADAWEWNRTG